MRAQASLVALSLAGSLGACGGGGTSGNTPKVVTTPTPAAAALHEGAPLAAPSEVVAGGLGLSGDVVDASHDAGGNLWAVGPRALYVRRAGLGAFEEFGTADGLKDAELLSVSGGAAGHAWVGYRGHGDENEDPPALRESGGAGEVTLVGADIDVRNFLLVTPAGTDHALPQGRYKTRACWRSYAVKSGPRVGDAWFGCNHGVSMWSATDGMQEHQHPYFCEIDPATKFCTLHAGDVPAVAFTRDGDTWLGGTYGVMKLDYTSPQGVAFHGATPVENELLWDPPLAPNRFGSVDVTGLAVAPDGTLWAASRHSGLAHRLNDGSVKLLEERDGLPSNRIVDLALDAKGRLWLATVDQGVFVVDLATLEWHRTPGLPSGNTKRVVAESIGRTDVVTVTVEGGVAIYR